MTQHRLDVVRPGLADLECAPEPEVPPEPWSDRTVGGYIVDLAEAGEDCRDALRSLRRLYYPPRAAGE